MKAVIIAGGKGTRLSPVIGDVPKALVKIGSKTIIEHQILLLKEYGIKEVWLLVGYLAEQIKDYLRDGKQLGVKIKYIQEDKPLGTAGALRNLEGIIKDDFLLFSGDIMFDIDIKRLIGWHRKKGDSIASFIVHPNDHPFDSDLVELGEGERIISLLRRPHPSDRIYRNLSISSFYLFSPKVLEYISRNRKTNIEKDILPKLLKSKEKVYAYNTPEYIKDAGTPERLEKVRKDYKSGRIKRLNLKNKRNAVFLDRDGVINKEVDQLSDVKDLNVFNFSAKAIKKINDLDYLAIVVTNQPMIAKGFISEKELDEMHKKLETELGAEGAKLDAIYYCPHHPEKGFEGERKDLKIACSCRKPKPGLILRAKKDFNINLKKSYLVGDQDRDILAGKKAGCKTILVGRGYGKSFSAKPDFFAKDLLSAVNLIASK